MGWKGLWMVVLAAVAAGCGRSPSTPPPARETPEQATARSPLSNEERERIVSLVKEARHEEGGPTYAAWIEEQLVAEPGGVLFRDWSVTRRDTGRYEVRFTYSLLDEDQRRREKGYSWGVDGLLNVVDTPRVLTASEGSPRPSLLDAEHRRQQQQDQLYSLE